MPDILFVHNNFPGQLGFVANAALAKGNRCAAIASHTAPGLPGFPVARWGPCRRSTDGIFPAAARAEASIIHGFAAIDCALKLQQLGFDPTVIVGHPGWGETLFLKQVFPRAHLIAYGEYYHAEGGALGYDPEFQTLSLQDRARDHARNATLALALADADRIVCPTSFQAGLLPAAFRAQATVIHEGVDTQRVRPDPTATLQLANGRIINRNTPVITFINRCFEPLRGFHVFMRALPRVMAELPGVNVVLIGSDGRYGYGPGAPEGTTWKQHFLHELDGRLDATRVHFTGWLPHDRMLAALSLSAVHVYYTYPFAVSWSLLDAMASECLIIASDNASVRDFLAHETNSLLLNFFDVDALAFALLAACREPARFLPLRAAARRTVTERFDREQHCLPRWLALIDQVGQQRPSN